MGFFSDLFGGSDELKKQKELFDAMSAMNAGGCTTDEMPDGIGEFGLVPTNPIPTNTVHVIHSLDEGRVLMVYSPPELEERTKALTSMTPEEMAVPGAVTAKLAEYGHVGVDE